MRIHQPARIAMVLSSVVLLAACAPTAVQPPRPLGDHFAALSPSEALTPQAQGARVRWSGGISRIEAVENGRQCFSILYATFDEQDFLKWPEDAQQFVACGTGRYDPGLVAQFTLVTLNGRVTGQQMQMGKPGPVIEIDSLYRHSDCVSGSESVDACYSGYLEPRQP